MKGSVVWGLGLGQTNPASARPKAGDLLVKAGDSDLKPLLPDDVPSGGPPVMAWAMDPADKTVRDGSLFNQVLLLRLDSEQLDPETKARAVEGVVGYSAICTHDGCGVDDWLAEEQLLHCGCHFSRFNPKAGAKVGDGPASRPLPALALKLMEGRLVVAEPFNARVG